MSLTSRTNRWASRMIIILQLATWNAVGIVLLHRGVSTLRRRILETNYVVEADQPTESVVSFTRHNENEYELSTQRQSIDKNMEIIIQIDSNRLSPHEGKNPSALGAIKSERLRDAFEIVSEEQPSTLFLSDPFGVPTTVRGTSDSRLENHLMEINQRIDDRFESKAGTTKISRTVRDREHILGKGISRIVHEEVDTTSIPDRSEFGIAGSISTKKEEEMAEVNSAENATQALIRETIRSEGTNRNQLALWTGKSNVRYSRLNEDGATTAVALVAIGAIMLLVGPVVILLRILDERRQTRKLIASPASAREDLPPTYEQAVLMDEAPRYSTLDLNYDRTPPPSPTLSSTYAFSNVAT